MSAQVQVPNFTSFMPESQKSVYLALIDPHGNGTRQVQTASRTEKVPDLLPERPSYLEMTPLASPESCMKLWAAPYSAAYTAVSEEMRCIRYHVMDGQMSAKRPRALSTADATLGGHITHESS
ncbi:hypothetical protein MRS44_000998 [Fusarium solani]|uniref:uncharacterized protein n=1 Tax=Fusarium solani TaxID=169388 RepID=UPI002315934E|nr:hypothetical protein MRS44_000998 [Fusarium solani]KAJ4216247.1 hypothetical protein NW759_009496 [Fusarium solani]